MTLTKPKNRIKNLVLTAAKAALLAITVIGVVTPRPTQAVSFDLRKVFSLFSINLAKAEEQAEPADLAHKPDKVVKAVITAYTSTKDQTDGDPFTAASGKKVHDGMIAANWLPMGTKVKIPALYGNKVFTVEDRMNPKHGGYGRLDIWMGTSRSEALKFGVKRVAVEIYYN